MRLGLIVRDDNTGLGNQTRELFTMLNPDKIAIINSSPFNNNKQNGWYKNFPNSVHSTGFFKKHTMSDFLSDIDVVISCETFYHNQFTNYARKRKIKTILQYNYEFLDYLQNDSLILPDVLVSPSKWNLDIVEQKFGKDCQVVHLPPPITNTNFPVETNLNNHNRVLHIAGRVAAKDRNGTQTVIDMLKHSKKDYELVIKIQGDFQFEVKDSRVTIDDSNPSKYEDLYKGFDLMVLPRRYAGLCLPMNEALLSAIPVFMTNVSPNNFVLPEEWLCEAEKIDTLMTRTLLDVYEGNPEHLGQMVDKYMGNKDKYDYKQKALSIGKQNFTPEFLEPKYQKLIKGESF